jgi:hypothetical protein
VIELQTTYRRIHAIRPCAGSDPRSPRRSIANILSRDQQIDAISALTEGCSIRVTERVGAPAPIRLVDWQDPAGDEPVEQMTDRREPLLDARRCMLARPGLAPVATFTGCTAAIDGTPASAHQGSNSSAARA